ncbi:hypothetical protein PCASD_00160 [Puccinia coronata f. sp. avenae]|uniref:Uncharacterized protein n=1 Tax=Puccinia coronata f. sp. avenae TaxID=200324 RepID=A0A2N5VQB9_9BASI|nr:hypothetical protein PCASD_00160 [Puccinia coronata f. sp. avenae]
MAASEFISDATIRFKLGRRATDLNRMAASDVNSDATIRASIAGSVCRPPDRIHSSGWQVEPFTTARPACSPLLNIQLSHLNTKRKLGLKSTLPAVRTEFSIIHDV